MGCFLKDWENPFVCIVYSTLPAACTQPGPLVDSRHQVDLARERHWSAFGTMILYLKVNLPCSHILEPHSPDPPCANPIYHYNDHLIQLMQSDDLRGLLVAEVIAGESDDIDENPKKR